jgi:hypothetical protein
MDGVFGVNRPFVDTAILPSWAMNTPHRRKFAGLDHDALVMASLLGAIIDSSSNARAYEAKDDCADHYNGYDSYNPDPDQPVSTDGFSLLPSTFLKVCFLLAFSAHLTLVLLEQGINSANQRNET